MIPSRVVVDERERPSGVPEELQALGVRVYFSRLPVADYVLTPEIAVERKSTKDVIASVYDSRLFYQAAQISAAYAKPYLLIEGDSKEVDRLAKNLKSYYGAIANITLAYGLRVVYTANPRETAIAILELLSHAKAKPVSHFPKEVPKSSSVPVQQANLVATLPGIGRKLAERLLLKYGTPRRVMSLTAGELAMTPGIGWSRAERIKQLMDAEYSKRPEAQKQTRLEQE